jgi:predicted nuclease with TOPRIM domain
MDELEKMKNDINNVGGKINSVQMECIRKDEKLKQLEKATDEISKNIIEIFARLNKIDISISAMTIKIAVMIGGISAVIQLVMFIMGKYLK